MEKDLISRKYAINQIDMAISKEESKEERERLLLIKEFLAALPSADLQQKVNEQLKWERDTAIEQLRSYGIDLGEKANVIKLPCKVGDIVYEAQYTRQRVQSYKIKTMKYNGRFWSFSWKIENDRGIYGNVDGFDSYQIGKTIFFNKEEAEAALKGETKQCAR